MKKWITILPLCLLLVACSDDTSFELNDISKDKTDTVEENKATVDEETKENDSEKNDESTGEVTEEEEESDVNETNEENSVVENKGLVEYMPKRPIKKVFLLQDFEIVRQVLSVKGNRLQESITFGDVVTMQISEWSPNKMTMLFNNAEGVADVTLNNFEATAAPEVYIDLLNDHETPQAWKVVGENLTLTMPAGTYENVLVVEQSIVSETSNQETITRYYFGKGLGVIKEEMITISGENKTTDVLELNRVE